MLSTFIGAIRTVIKAAAGFAALLLLLITAAVSYEIVARFIFRSPTEWTFELTGYGLVWCSFLSAAYALENNHHVRVELFTERLSPLIRSQLERFVDVIGIAFCSAAAWEGFLHVRLSYLHEHTSNTPLAVPMYLAELGVPVGMLLLALAFLCELLVSLRSPAKAPQ